MLTETRIRVDKSNDGDGWSVRVGEVSWRFNRVEFATQFADRFTDEHFRSEIIEHAHNHDWERCQAHMCKGALWQIIQGME